MKTSLLIALPILLLLCPSAKSQDIIIKNDQAEVLAKVTEIMTDDVKFKYFNRLDGPTYTLKKSEIFVIIYKDGTREKFGPVATKPSTTAAPSAYAVTPVIEPAPATPTRVTPAYAASTESAGKRHGWTSNVGYTTPVQDFGNTNGISYGGGYYFLGPGRKGGFLFDVDVMNMFGEGTPNYGLLAVNALFRTSDTSKFYLGGGVGYGTVSVKFKDFYGATTTYSSGDFGGKAFMGYGMLRVALVWPSLQSIDSGGLLTVGLSLNPFN